MMAAIGCSVCAENPDADSSRLMLFMVVVDTLNAAADRKGKIKVESIEYNGWGEEEFVKIRNRRDREIADIWENSDSLIELIPLKLSW